MAQSLTPQYASDLRAVISYSRVGRIIKEHGLDAGEFWGERGTQSPVRLKELRDWLGY